MTYGYIRISTDMQDADNQRYEIQRYCERSDIVVDEWLEETVSSRKAYEKRGLSKLVSKTVSGDFILCTEISRIGRNVYENFKILQVLVERKVTIHTIRDGYKFEDNLQSTILAFTFSLAAQIEREQISQRTKHGLALKKAQGVVLGRPKGTRNEKSKLDEHHDVIMEYLDKGIGYSGIARMLGVHRSTVSDYVERKLESYTRDTRENRGKLTNENVRLLKAKGMSVREIARYYNISIATLGKRLKEQS